MRSMLLATLGVALLAACGSSDDDDDEARSAPGTIERLEVVATADAFGGATPAGAAGPYSVITAIAHGRLDPDHPDNAGIVDLDKAPVGEDGRVAYTTDVVILRPKAAADARRVLLYDVVNRGNKIAQGLFVGGGDLTTGPAPGESFQSVLRGGYTVVWSGWQGTIAQTGNGAAAAIGTRFPAARNADGSAITGLVREEYIADAAGVPTIPLTYPPASLTDRSEVSLTARQSWLDADGRMDYAVPAAAVDTWSYVTNDDGSVSVRFTPPAAVPTPAGDVPADAGTIYSFVYRARDPQVLGVGFAAVRDLVGYLKYEEADEAGNANPVADMREAACAAATACPDDPDTNYDVAIAEGLSQSGRFLRDFLYQGFNSADGRQVFDGMVPMIPGGRRMWLNERFAQPGRWSKQHEDHWMPGDQFPFAYNVIDDPVGGGNDGLLKRCLANDTCPKIMQIDGSYEWWGGRGSLVVTDGAGRDLPLPENVRYYLVAGAQHGGGPGVTTGIVTQPAEGATCRYAPSPVSMAAAERALLLAMEDWIVAGTPPPPSTHPTVAAGTAVRPTRAALGFPDLSDIRVPDGAAATPLALSVEALAPANQLFVTDYGNAVPVADLSRPYTLLVPKVDANGNETAGILTPEQAVPLGTYTAWNVRAEGHAAGDACLASGSALPFAVDAASRAAGDPRATLSTLYPSRAAYFQAFDAAADGLVEGGFLTELDAANAKTGARSVSDALIP